MALVFDNATLTAGATSANVRVLIHTAVADSVLLVFVQSHENTSISAMAAGGIPCTRLDSQIWGAGVRIQEVWGLTAPAAGALTISAIHVGNAPSLWAMGAVTYTGHKTDVGGPFGGTGKALAYTSTSVAQLILSVSATSGNKIIALMGNETTNISTQAGTVRLSATAAASNTLQIVDLDTTAASHLLTATATGNTRWMGLGVHLIASATGNVTGVLSATDAPDLFSAPSYVLVRGTFSATDAQDTFSAPAAVRISAGFAATDSPDTFSASGYVTNPRITGIFSATEAADTFTAPGYVLVRGTFSATDSPDAFSAAAYAIVQGTFNAVETQDSFSAPSYVLIQGSFAATDTQDKFTATAAVVNAATQAVFSATDAQDSFAAAGYTLINGTFNAVDSPDTFSASGTSNALYVTATFNAVDAPDTFTATSYVVVSGAFTATDSPDAFSSEASVVSLSVSAAAVTTDPGAGHGKRSNDKLPYIRASEAFWAAREEYLRSLQPEIAQEPEPAPAPIVTTTPDKPTPAPILIDPSILPSYIATRNRLVTALPAATTLRQLYKTGDRLRSINAQIAQQKRLQLEAERALRKQARLRLIRKNKKMLAYLLAAQALLKIYFNSVS